jgi:hypothetical protein
MGRAFKILHVATRCGYKPQITKIFVAWRIILQQLENCKFE